MIRSAVTVRGNKGVTGTLAANAGDLRLRAVIGSPFLASGGGPTFDFSGGGISLSLEKPGSFILDYDLPNQDVRFQFMNTLSVSDRQLNWTYTHSRGENRTLLDGTLVVDQANRISSSYELGSRNAKLKYSYVHRGVTAVEPCYDFGKKSWDLSVSHWFEGDVIRVSYDTASKNLAFDWSWKTLLSKEGKFKISTCFNLAEQLQMPKVSVETLWNFEM